MDTNFNIIWDKKIYLNFTYKYVKGLLPIDTQHLILAPVLYNDSTIAPEFGEILPVANLIKLDTLGNIIWHKKYDTAQWINMESMIRAHDGNILVCGLSVRGNGPGDNGAAWVMKVDTAGNKLWHKTYNLPGYDGLSKIVATPDGNYVCVGWGGIASEIQDMPNGVARALKINENGDLIWDKIINISPRSEEFRTVVAANNGDIVAFGSTYKYYAYDQYNYEVGSTREPDGWAVRLDPQGNEVWNRVFGHDFSVPYAHDYIYNALALPDGSFVGGGTTHIQDSFINNNGVKIPYLRQAAWLFKLDANGCISESCPENLSEIYQVDTPTEIGKLELYPNPGNGKAILESSTILPEGSYLCFTDVLGRYIQPPQKVGGLKKIPVDLSQHAAGMYLLRLVANGKQYSFKYSLIWH